MLVHQAQERGKKKETTLCFVFPCSPPHVFSCSTGEEKKKKKNSKLRHCAREDEALLAFGQTHELMVAARLLRCILSACLNSTFRGAVFLRAVLGRSVSISGLARTGMARQHRYVCQVGCFHALFHAVHSRLR